MAASAPEVASSSIEETWYDTGPLEVWKIKVPGLANEEKDGKSFHYVLADYWTDGDLIALWLRGTRVIDSPLDFMMSGGDSGSCKGSPMRASRFLLVKASDFSILGHHHLNGWAWMFGFYVKDVFVGVDSRWKMLTVVRKSDGSEIKGALNEKIKKLMGQSIVSRFEALPVSGKKTNAVCFFAIDMVQKDKYGNAFKGMDGQSYAVFCYRVEDITDQNSEPRVIPIYVPKGGQSHYSIQCITQIEFHHKLFAVSDQYFVVTMPCTYNTSIYSFTKTPGRELHKLTFMDFSQDFPVTFFAPHLLLYPLFEGDSFMDMDRCSLGMKDLSAWNKPAPWKGHDGNGIKVWAAAVFEEDLLALGCVERGRKLSIRIWRASDGFELVRPLTAANKKFNLNHCYDFNKELRFSSDGRFLVVFVHQKNGELVPDCVSVVSIFKWEEKDSPVRSISFKTKPVDRFFGPMDGYSKLPCEQMWAPIFWDDPSGSILALSPKKLTGALKTSTGNINALTPTTAVPASKYVLSKMKGGKDAAVAPKVSSKAKPDSPPSKEDEEMFRRIDAVMAGDPDPGMSRDDEEMYTQLGALWAANPRFAKGKKNKYNKEVKLPVLPVMLPDGPKKGAANK